jgi:thiol-disulfide isomerase/thioredoxin
MADGASWDNKSLQPLSVQGDHVMSMHARIRRFRGLFAVSMLVAAVGIAAPARQAHAQSSTIVADERDWVGLWDATVVVNELEVPFRFEIAAPGHGNTANGASTLRGSFFDGDRKVSSTQASLSGDALTLRFDQYLAVLDLKLTDGRLEGQYSRGSRGAYRFKATRVDKAARIAESSPAPSIAGEYTIPTQSNKGEAAWRFIVRQNGSDVSAAILRVDGDTGTLTGAWRDGKFVLSHFSGARPSVLEVTPAADGTLDILQNGKNKLVAVKADSAKARDVAAPTDPAKHTTINNRDERFQFALPDLDGRTVADTDPRFQGKVVIISITGSWCPNCHDEAPFLAELQRKYRKKGLEVVAFSFEEAEQLTNPTRLRAFVKEYGLDYTVLLAGEPAQLAEKVPQVSNLNSFPTTLFVGRDGKLKSTHAGFPSPASGNYYKQARKDITALVERLLEERPSAGRTIGTH